MAKNNELNLIASVKLLRVGFSKKCIINSEKGGGYSVLVFLLSTFIKHLFISPIFPIIFLYKI